VTTTMSQAYRRVGDSKEKLGFVKAKPNVHGLSVLVPYLKKKTTHLQGVQREKKKTCRGKRTEAEHAEGGVSLKPRY